MAVNANETVTSVSTDFGSSAAANDCEQTLPTRLPASIPHAVVYLQATVALVTMILGVSMNTYVVILVSRHKALHKMSFYLALQIIVAHLVFSCTVLPVTFVTALLGEWRLGTFMCQLLGLIHDLIITIRYLLTFVLTLDRVICVFCPFFYMRHGRKIAVCASAAVWLIGVFRSVTSLKGLLNCTRYVPAFKTCAGAAFCSDICQAHTLFFANVLGLFGVIIPFILYVALFAKGKMIRRQLRSLLPSLSGPRARSQLQHRISPTVLSNSQVQNSNIKNELHVENEVSVMSVLEGDTDCIAHQNTESLHNNRATITFFMLTVVIIGCALPPYVLYTILAVNPSPVVVILMITVGRTLVFALAFADPIVIMRNRDVRELFQSKLCGCGNSHYRSDM